MAHLSETPQRRPHPTETLRREIESLQKQIQKQVEAMKTELAKQLDTACDTVKTLRELGVKDIFKDPQFSEYVDVLGIETEQKKVEAVKRSARGASQTAIIEILQSGHSMSHKDIVDRLSANMGKKAPHQFITLSKMVERKVLTKTGEGKAATYKLASK